MGVRTNDKEATNMSTVRDMLYKYCTDYHVPYAVYEQLLAIIIAEIERVKENAVTETWTKAREECNNAGYIEGYEKGKVDGELQGRSNVLEEVANDIEIESDTRDYIHKKYIGGE